MKLINIFYLLFLFHIFGYGQENNLEKKHHAEIVYFEDSNLKDLLKKYIKKDNSCKVKGLQWYVDFKKENTVLFSKHPIENLIASNGIDKIYVTTIDDTIVFIVNAENNQKAFKSSGFSVELSSFIGKSNYSTLDYSFWVFQKIKSKKYKMVKEKKFKCDQ